MSETSDALKKLEEEKKKKEAAAKAAAETKQAKADLKSKEQELTQKQQQFGYLTSDINLYKTSTETILSAVSNFAQNNWGPDAPGKYTALYELNPGNTDGLNRITYAQMIQGVNANVSVTKNFEAVRTTVMQKVNTAESQLKTLQKQISTLNDEIKKLKQKLGKVAKTGDGTNAADTADTAAADTAGYDPLNPIVVAIATSGSGLQYGSYNPPPHEVTRSIAVPSLRTSEPGLFWDANGNVINGDSALVDKYIDSMTNRLGYIYQDPDANVNLRGKKSKDAKASDPDPTIDYSVTDSTGNKVLIRGKEQVWGFQFTYNPTTIRQTLTVDPATDWTLTDKSNALTGTGTIDVDLWLNRIMDMRTLTKNVEASAGYSRKLTVTDVNGILNRGTNYDLEFLYRVVNGDPVAGLPLVEAGELTSDFGYITGIPIWINFGGSQRYKCSMKSISITHMIFTKDMIPMLTQISVSLARYPVNNSVEATAAYDRAKNVISSQTLADQNTNQDAKTGSK